MVGADTNPGDWGFYGRSKSVHALLELLQRRTWFFLKVGGRRRIGKTRLVQEAVRKAGCQKTLYLQIPDADAGAVVQAAAQHLKLSGIERDLPTNLIELARTLRRLIEDGYVITIDEFQYFHRRSLYEFTSFLQHEVDTILSAPKPPTGGLIVLGSIQTEIDALFDDRRAPLFGRLDGQLELEHLEVAAIRDILREHADLDPRRLLFLWNLFEGVPKFYRDAHAKRCLGGGRLELLKELYFADIAPLRDEADTWLHNEVRGHYDVLLQFVAEHPGCASADIEDYVKTLDFKPSVELGGYLRVLRDRYRMIEQLQPAFSQRAARRGRFYLSDNFLRTWLGAVQSPVRLYRFTQDESLIATADARLQTMEGHGLERLVDCNH